MVKLSKSEIFKPGSYPNHTGKITRDFLKMIKEKKKNDLDKT